MAPSGSKKGIQVYYPFHSQSPGKRIPSRFPIGPPMERDTRLQGIFKSLLIYLFYLSLRVPGKGAPSKFPNRFHIDRGTPSPEPLVYSFIHVCLPESPKRSPPAYKEKLKVSVHGTPLSLQQKCEPGAFPGGKGGRCLRLATLPLSCDVMKSGNFNFLGPSGPLRVCNETALPLSKKLHGTDNVKLIERSIVGNKNKFILQSDRLAKSNNCKIGLDKLSPAL